MRTAYIVLAGLTLLNVVFQFVTAGAFIGGLGNDGDWLDPHGGGSIGIHLFPLLMIIVAAVGKLGRDALLYAVAVLVLGMIQVAITETGIAFLHPLNALIIFVVAHRALHHMRGRAPGAEPIAAT